MNNRCRSMRRGALGVRGLLVLACVLAVAPAAFASTGEVVAEEVTFPSGDVTLAGTLTLPPGPGPHPAVITISGSGPQDRDSRIPGVPGYRPFRDIAEHLNRLGFAVLRYDDRGVGASGGVHATATSLTLARDAEAAVRYLGRRGDIDGLTVGLLGHSEGGMIAPMIAARNPAVAFLIALAPPVAEPIEGLVRQERRMLEAAGMPADLVDLQVARTRQVLELTRAAEWETLETVLRDTVREQLAALPEAQREQFGDPEVATEALVAQTLQHYRGWMRTFLRYDVQADWATLRVPALAVFAGRDVQVDLEQHRAALESAMDDDAVTIAVVEEANHLFQVADTGSVTEYGDLPPDLAPSLFTTLASWLEANVGTPAR